MSDYLPPEVLQDILKWLPVKTLLRFRIVSKHWYSLISNPNFISQHLLHTTLRTPPHALFSYCTYDLNRPSLLIEEHYSLRFDNDDSFDEYMKPEFPFKSSGFGFGIVGCCNGLLCLADHLSDDKWCYLHLWNPSVGKSVAVAVPFKGSGSYFPHFGFGFDELTNDYKVVAYMKPLDKGVQPWAEIYSLRSRIWLEISTKGLRYPLLTVGEEPINLNGVAHWYGISSTEVLGDPVHESIVTFSFKDEVYGEMMLPAKGSLPYKGYRNLMIYQDSLAFIDVADFGLCCTWVMKNYGVQESWTLLFKVGAPVRFGRPIGFRMNGELVVAGMKGELDVECSRKSLVSYDPKSKLVKDLVIWGSDEIKDYRKDELENVVVTFYLGRYMESLVLLDKVASTPEHIDTSDRSLLM